MFRSLKNFVTVMKHLYKTPDVSIPESISFIESQLKEGMHPSTVQQCWSCHIPKALSLGSDKGGTNILVTTHNKQLHFLKLDGHITNVLSLPAKFVSIETGWHHTYRTVLLGNTDYKMYAWIAKAIFFGDIQNG